MSKQFSIGLSVFALMLAVLVYAGWRTVAINPVSAARPDTLVIVRAASADGGGRSRVFHGAQPVGHLYSALLLVGPGYGKSACSSAGGPYYRLTFLRGHTVLLRAAAQAQPQSCLRILLRGRVLNGRSDQGQAFYAALDNLLGLHRGSTIDDPVAF